jgi:hypothetical protein
MEETLPQKACQLHCIPVIQSKRSRMDAIWNLFMRIIRAVKRRLRFIWATIEGMRIQKSIKIGDLGPLASGDVIRPGATVRIRTREEIKTTLDKWNRLRGCVFMEEMARYCGTVQKVLKKVERFLDERDYSIRKSRGIVILEGVLCQGTVDFGPCDRTCYFFWREEWLQAI